MEHEDEIIITRHQDLIHDMAIDWHGTRLATASSDNMIRIYRRSEGSWEEECSFRMKGGPNWRVKWSRPEFGRVLAVIGIDRNLYIYELRKKWTEVYKEHFMKGIEDVKFIPYQSFGLFIAIVTFDGELRVYQATDITNLTIWTQDKQMQMLVCPAGLNCLTWSKWTKAGQHPFIAVGCKGYEGRQEPATAHRTLQLVCLKEKEELSLVDFPHEEYGNVRDVSWAPLNGRSFELLVYAGASGAFVLAFRIKQSKIQIIQKYSLEQVECMRASWNIIANAVAVSTKHEVKIFSRKHNSFSLQREIVDPENDEPS